MASKLFDIKGMLNCPQFDGRGQNWQEFKFRFENLSSMLGLIEGVRWSERHSLEETDSVPMSELDKVKDQVLYTLLLQTCTGRAITIMRQGPVQRGLLAWRYLVEDYEPRIPTRLASVLSSLLSPNWKT